MALAANFARSQGALSPRLNQGGQPSSTPFAAAARGVPPRGGSGSGGLATTSNGASGQLATLSGGANNGGAQYPALSPLIRQSLQHTVADILLCLPEDHCQSEDHCRRVALSSKTCLRHQMHVTLCPFAPGSEQRRFSASTATTSNGTTYSYGHGPGGTPLRSGSANALRTASTSSSNSAGYHTCVPRNELQTTLRLTMCFLSCLVPSFSLPND